MTMPYEVEHEGRHGGGGVFLAGLLMGAAIGAGLALLFAPKKGSELRDQIAESARKARESARDAYRHAAEKAGAAASRAKSEAERTFRGAVGGPRGQQP
jgi:gas vesicle protein